jgi:hypothetical protein
LVIDFGKVEAPQVSNTGEVPAQVLFSDLREVKLAQVATPGEAKEHVNESQVMKGIEDKLMQVASLQGRVSVGASAHGDDDGRDSMALPGVCSASSTDPPDEQESLQLGTSAYVDDDGRASMALPGMHYPPATPGSLLLGTAGISHSPPPTNRTNRTNRAGRRGTFRSERRNTEADAISTFTPRKV